MIRFNASLWSSYHTRDLTRIRPLQAESIYCLKISNLPLLIFNSGLLSLQSISLSDNEFGT